ncbi:MAG TPA: DUF4388 domain-containing protein [Longimicrobiaceae bacterium]|nr:DUF4388 domain-containing protein [Longimicrobiaceae bacterium]
MAIKGSLREASLPDVLQLLAMGQKTGCLAVTDRANFGYIYFDRGRITYASIVNRRDRLGDLLVKNELLSSAELAAAVDAQSSDFSLRLGEILVARGSITREQLEQYIRIQIEEAVYFLFTWNQGSFYFEADQRPDPDAMQVLINPESLLLEGARRIDEWSLIEKKVTSLDMIFAVDDAARPDSDELTAEQQKIFPLLDGSRSVHDLIDESGLVDFEAGKALFGLIQAGFARPVGRKEAQREIVAPSRIHEHRNLGIAFYRTGMFEEGVREFRRVLDLEPENREARFHLGLIGLRSGEDQVALSYFMELAELGSRSASTFHNMALALERLGRQSAALVAVEEALRLAPNSPQILLSRAILLLKTGRAPEAAAAFGAYREVLGDHEKLPSAYFIFATIAEAAAGRDERAEAIGYEGLERYPSAGRLLVAAGAVHERRGEWDEAEALYSRAVDDEPDLPQAQQSFGDARYRRGAYDQAAEAYERVLQLAPHLAEDACFKLGNIHYKRGQREEAIALWRRVLELNPDHGVAATNLELVQTVLAGAP